MKYHRLYSLIDIFPQTAYNETNHSAKKTAAFVNTL